MISIKRISWVIVALMLCIGAASSVCYATDYLVYAEQYWNMTVFCDQSITPPLGMADVWFWWGDLEHTGGVALDATGNSLYTTEFEGQFDGYPTLINKWVKAEDGTWSKVAPSYTAPGNSMPLYGVVVGADGKLYANRNWQFLDVFDVSGAPTLTVEYDGGRNLNARDIAYGPDGTVWSSGCSKLLARWNTQNGAQTTYDMPSVNFMTLTFGPDADNDGWSDVYMPGENRIEIYSGRTGAFIKNYLTGLPDNLTQCDLAFTADGNTLYYMTNNFGITTSLIKKYDVTTQTTTVFLNWPPMAWGQMALTNPYVPVCPPPPSKTYIALAGAGGGSPGGPNGAYCNKAIILDEYTGAAAQILPGDAAADAAGGVGGVAFDSAGNLYTNGFTNLTGGASNVNKWTKSGTTWTKVTPEPYIACPAGLFYGVVVGADGKLCVNRNSSYLDVYNGSTLVKEIDCGQTLNSRDIAYGPDGTVWTAGGNSVLTRWNTQGNTWTTYGVPSASFMTLTFGPDANADGWSDVYMSGDNKIIICSGKDGAFLGNYLTGLSNVTQCDLAFSADGKTLYYMAKPGALSACVKAYDITAGTTRTLFTSSYQKWGQMSLSNPYVPVCPNATPVNYISDLQDIADDTVVSIEGKSLYLKQDTFGYIEEPTRASGIRIQYSACASSEGDLVDVVGTLKTTAGGERYIDIESITTSGAEDTKPLGANNRAAKMSLMNGLLVKVWGTVKAGTLGANSFVITDGSDSDGLPVITAGAPGVTEGTYVDVTGAAGYNSGRVIYRK